MINGPRPPHPSHQVPKESKVDVGSERKAGPNALGAQAQLPVSAARASVNAPKPSLDGAQPQTAVSTRQVEISEPSAIQANHSQVKSIAMQVLRSLGYNLAIYDLDAMAAKFMVVHHNHELDLAGIREEFGRLGMTPEKLDEFRR